LRCLGTSTLWFAFHGADEIHDQAVLYNGAYSESLRAVELVREAGMRTGCNLFLTKENIGQFDQLVADLQPAGIQEISPETYSFVPHARGRHAESLRPEWQDVQALVKKLDSIPETCVWRRFWYELPDKHTESWYVRQALEGTWPDEPMYRMISLVCRPNLDVYRGLAGLYTRRYGNLRRDGVDAVLSRAVADGAASDDELRFTREQLLLPIQELAARFGHPHSQRIHMHPGSIRRWWLDCARRAGPN
jgi:MoaA/NifB/PqqE/SkfB family radical SAM enzyme